MVTAAFVDSHVTRTEITHVRFDPKGFTKHVHTYKYNYRNPHNNFDVHIVEYRLTSKARESN